MASTQRYLPCLVTWIDQTFQQFRYGLSQDLENPLGYGNQHKKAYLRLDKRHPDLQDDFREIDAKNVARSLKRESDDDNPKRKRQRKDDDAKGAERDTPQWFTLMPKAANGKPRCARYLLNKGCPSTRKGKYPITTASTPGRRNPSTTPSPPPSRSTGDE